MLPALADSFFTPSATSDGVAMVLSDAAETRLSGEHIRTLLIGLHNVEQLLNNFHWNLKGQTSHQDLKQVTEIWKVEEQGGEKSKKFPG